MQGRDVLQKHDILPGLYLCERIHVAPCDDAIEGRGQGCIGQAVAGGLQLGFDPAQRGFGGGDFLFAAPGDTDGQLFFL